MRWRQAVSYATAVGHLATFHSVSEMSALAAKLSYQCCSLMGGFRRPIRNPTFLIHRLGDLQFLVLSSLWQGTSAARALEALNQGVGEGDTGHLPAVLDVVGQN